MKFWRSPRASLAGRRSRTAGAAIAYAAGWILGLVVAPGDARAAGPALHPILECVIENGPGDFVAHFGYLNDYATPVTVPVGADNKFTPSPIDRGQPTVFQPGRTPFYPGSAFQVPFDGNNLVWTLASPDGSRRTSTASANSTRCPVIPSNPLGYSACYQIVNQLLQPYAPNVFEQPVDDLVESKILDVRRARILCVPAEATVGNHYNPIIDGGAFALGRKIGQSRTKPPQPPFRAVDHQNVVVEDDFGSHLLQLLRYNELIISSALCDPSVESCPATAEQLPLGGLSRDEYKCYDVRLQAGSPKFSKVNIVGNDRFQSRVYRVTNPKMLCTQASRNGHDPAAAQDEFGVLCYRMKPALFYCEPGAPAPYSLAPCLRDIDCGGSQCILVPKPYIHQRRDGLLVNNALGSQRVRTIREDLICAPASITP